MKKHRSPETEFKKGSIPWNKGLQWDEKSKQKMSIAHKGKIGFWNGKKRDESTIKKMSNTMKKLGHKPCNSPNWYHLSGDKHPTKVVIEKELLYSLYYGNDYSKEDICKIFKCSRQTIYKYFYEYKMMSKKRKFVAYKKDDRHGFQDKVRNWRNKVFKRDDYTCQYCHDRGKKGHKIILNAHHIKSWKDYPKERFNISNGITLCEDCHMYIHHRFDVLSQQ